LFFVFLSKREKQDQKTHSLILFLDLEFIFFSDSNYFYEQARTSLPASGKEKEE